MKRHYWPNTLVWLDRLANCGTDVNFDKSAGEWVLVDMKSRILLDNLLPERFWSYDASDGTDEENIPPEGSEDRGLLGEQAELIRATVMLLK